MAVDTIHVHVNRPPTFDTTNNTDRIIIGEKFRYDVDASDLDNDQLAYDLPYRPSGMTINRQTGLIVWEPGLVHEGKQRVVVRVQDGQGGIATQSFKLDVINDNAAPEITSLPLGPARVGVPYEYPIIVTDENGDQLVYSVEAPSAALAGNTDAVRIVNGVLKWTPSVVGDYHAVGAVRHKYAERGGGASFRRRILLDDHKQSSQL